MPTGYIHIYVSVRPNNEFENPFLRKNQNQQHESCFAVCRDFNIVIYICRFER